MTAPKEGVDELERGAELPGENEERFVGYGVMGVPLLPLFSWTRAEVAGLVERAEEEVGREPVRRDAVSSRHGAGRKERVQDGLLGSLRRRVEQRRHALARHHLQRYRSRRA